MNRIGQVFADDSDVLLVVDSAVYEYDPRVPAWRLLSLENGQQYIMSEDWVKAQEQLDRLVRP